MKLLPVLILSLLLTSCIGVSFDPCSDVLTWDYQDGNEYEKAAWLEATRWWNDAGARFADYETEDGNYRVHVLHGTFFHQVVAGTEQVMPGGGYSNITLDPDKVQSNYYAMAAIFAHEIGHSFGFGHVPTVPQGGVDSIMNTFRTFGEFRGVTEYDKAKFRSKCGR
jgi:hypothetical protein